MTDTQLAELEALCQGATPGPWLQYDMGGSWEISNEPACVIPIGRVCPDPLDVVVIAEELTSACDAAFIATARTAVPALIAALREAGAERDAMRLALQHLVTVLEVDGGYTVEATAEMRADCPGEDGEPWDALDIARNALTKENC